MYTVTVYFDNMIDETHYFEDEEEAEKMYRSLELYYRRNRLYRVVKEEIPGQEERGND